MLHLGDGHGGILHAEVRHLGRRAAQVGDQRIVGVEHEASAPACRGGGHRCPSIGDRVELAVAVELIAEQVAEQDAARLELRDHPVEPELVELEQPKLAGDPTARAGGGHQRRGHAAGHVRPGPVVDDGHPLPGEHRGHHRGCRGLAVGGRDHDRAARQPCGQLADRPRLEREQHAPGQARPAAAPGPPGQLAHRARRGDLRAEQRHAGTIIRTAPGRTRTVTGSSAIASPSAYRVNGSLASIRTSRPRSTPTSG